MIGCWLLVVCLLLVVGCLFVIGCLLLVVGCWLLVVGCFLASEDARTAFFSKSQFLSKIYRIYKDMQLLKYSSASVLARWH